MMVPNYELIAEIMLFSEGNSDLLQTTKMILSFAHILNIQIILLGHFSIHDELNRYENSTCPTISIHVYISIYIYL